MVSKIIILGAGPTGLAFANRLLQLGEDRFVVIEKEKVAGGLCRSVAVDGAPFDIGGGHFLDVRHPEVNQFLFQFMQRDEWNIFERDSRISINGTIIGHPIEANIWQMKIEDQIEYLKSISSAGCNTGEKMPELFAEWIYWKLGKRIADDYMIPYNQKMFGTALDELGTYWLEKLPSVSFEETLRSCLEKKPYGEQPGHAQFLYPKKAGYGELWLRMADIIREHIVYKKTVRKINFKTRTVTTADGCSYSGETIISTIPWPVFEEMIGMPEHLVHSVMELKHTSVVTEYFPQKMDTNAHWIYYPDANISYHRALVRSNFCYGSNGYWTETNGDRAARQSKNFRHINQYAYPLNTVSKPKIMRSLLAWSASHNVYGIGRWGEHQHYNSDVAVRRALEFAQRRPWYDGDGGISCRT